MPRSDCIILFNAAASRHAPFSREKVYPANLVREEVGAVEESLRELGFFPAVLTVDQFSKDLVSELSRLAPKFVFNLCEEINGNCEQEMCVAGLFELMGIPYTGSGPLALGLALNKFRVKQVLRAAGVPAPRGYLCCFGQRLRAHAARRFSGDRQTGARGCQPGINADSVCRDSRQLEDQVAYIHDVYRQDALIEEYLEAGSSTLRFWAGARPRCCPFPRSISAGCPRASRAS